MTQIMTIIPRPHDNDGIHVGVSPSDVSWNVYRKTNESDEDFMARAETMHERLVVTWSKTVRTVKLTKSQSGWVAAAIDSFIGEDDGLSDYNLSKKFKQGVTFARGTEDDLDMLDDAVFNLLDTGDFIGCMNTDVSAHLWSLMEKQAEECLNTIRTKLASRPLAMARSLRRN